MANDDDYGCWFMDVELEQPEVEDDPSWFYSDRDDLPCGMTIRQIQSKHEFVRTGRRFNFSKGAKTAVLN